MLFFKSKKYDEILPPPPPEAELEEEAEKPELFDEVIKPEKAKISKEEEEFEDLLKEVKSLKPKKSFPTKKQKIPKKEVKIKKIPIKKVKEKKITIKKRAQIKQIKNLPIKKTKKEKIKKLIQPKEKKLKNIDFVLPKEIEKPSEKELELPEELEKIEDIELPDTLEDFDIEELGKELNLEPKTKPKELIEAEDEIKTAIERIKEWNASERSETRSQLTEKPSFLKKLFAKREKIEETEMPEIEDNKVSAIQNKINKAREALMKFDLEGAKRNYIELMKLYNNIKPEEQAKIYHEIKELYFERKSAEELKV